MDELEHQAPSRALGAAGVDIDLRSAGADRGVGLEGDEIDLRTPEERRASALGDDELDGLLVTRPPRTVYTRFGKRAFDIAVSALVLVLLAPLLVVVALAVRLTLGRGIIFRQQRVGRGGDTFTMLKFRTMHPCRRTSTAPWTGVERRVTHKADHDPRHTRLGRFLRATSIDELPQLVNVLKGDMSIVGPRPELATVVDEHDLRNHPRHGVLPGITGPWQTTTRNDGVLLHQCVDDDLGYVETVNLRTDLRVLVRTVGVLCRAAGR